MVAKSPPERKSQADEVRAAADRDIERFLCAMFKPGEVFEVRAPKTPDKPGGKFTATTAGYFNDPTTAARAVSELDASGRPPAIYCTLNPCNPDLLARATNRLKDKAAETTSDDQTTRRTHLLIDVDAIRQSGMSSTEDEMDGARRVATQIREDQKAAGWPDAMQTMSGNGAGIVYSIDLPNDATSEALIDRDLKALAQQYDGPGISIDQAVKNAARITKIPGTMVRKGDDFRGAPGIPARPWRRSYIDHFPDEGLVSVPRELLEQLAAKAPKPPPQADRPRPVNSHRMNGTKFETFEHNAQGVRGYLERYGVTVKGIQDKGGATFLNLERCPVNSAVDSSGNNDISVIVGNDGKIAYRNLHNRGDGMTWEDVREALEPGYRAFVSDARRKHDGNGKAAAPRPEPPPAGAEEHASNGKAAKPTGWGEPIPLDVQPPPEMPAGIFTGWLGAQVHAVAAATETPIELPGAYALACMGMVCQGRFSVRPEPGYFEALAFWTACAMPPAARKSAVMSAMTGWAYDWQRRKRADFEEIIRQAQADDTLTRARVKLLRDRATKAKEPTEAALLKAEADEAEKTLQPIPVAPRLLAEDVTTEHLATMLAAHNERLGIFSDEAGPLDNWGGRYSAGIANIDLPLKAHTGTPVTVDRGSKPSALLGHPLLSIGLAPQPAVIAGLVTNQVFRRRGLPARFFFFLPPSRLGYRSLQAQPVPEDVAKEYARRMTELAELEAAPADDGGRKPRPLTLSAKAWRDWKDFAIEVERQMRPDGALEHLTDWAGKLPGAIARAAGLFHLAEHGPDAVRVDEIGIEPMARAIELGRFAIPHAKAVFEGMDATGDIDYARRMWREASSDVRREERAEKGNPAIISLRDLWHPMRGTLKTTAEADPAIRILIDHNFIRELPNDEQGRPGRPSRRFRINPVLAADW